jgi:hypothetical protein
MAKEFDSKKMTSLVNLLKKEGVGTLSETQVVEHTGIERSQVLRYLCVAEVTADPSLKIKPTGPAIAKAKDGGLRWPRVAARAGISESKAKELYQESTGKDPATAYSGRGRKFDGSGSAASGRRGAGRSGSKTKAAPAATSGRRGRGAAGAAKKTAAAPTRGRRGTRASAAADPK